MKIGGVDPKTLDNEVFLVLPRQEQNIVFRARGLRNMAEFDERVPFPKPPGKLTKDGWVPDDTNDSYQATLKEWNRKRTGYMVIHSLEPSEIEWDTVDRDDPRSWPHWEEDLLNAGLTSIEVNRVLALVLEANALDEVKLQQARDSFLRGREPQPSASSGPHTEQDSTPSGEPASA